MASLVAETKKLGISDDAAAVGINDPLSDDALAADLSAGEVKKAEPAAPLDEDARRAEIMKRLAEARAKKKAEEEAAKAEKAGKFGLHQGITCDGCGIAPIMGFRYHCLDCKNHDICESCYEVFKGGKLNHVNKANKVNASVDGHRFKLMADRANGFKPMKSGEAGGAGVSMTTEKKAKKVKPNDPCPCGSGKKFKKCGALEKCVKC